MCSTQEPTLWVRSSLKYVLALPKSRQASFLARLDQVRHRGHNIGWGVDEDFDEIWSAAGLPLGR